MHLQIASDLHLEFLKQRFPSEMLIQPAAEADLLVLAGDICHGTDAIALFRDWPVPVLYLAGNHEFYKCDLQATRDSLRAAAQGTNVRFLDNDAIDIDGIRFLGTTLWTDYRLGADRTQEQLMAFAEPRINDHSLIRCGNSMFTAQRALAEHALCRAWLEGELRVPHHGKTVVISHHGPHPLSIHPRYAGEPLNAAFNSDLSELLPYADLWVHGHVHDSFDYAVHGCRVVANPAGYARNRQSAKQAADLVFENAMFARNFVVQV